MYPRHVRNLGWSPLLPFHTWFSQHKNGKTMLQPRKESQMQYNRKTGSVSKVGICIWLFIVEAVTCCLMEHSLTNSINDYYLILNIFIWNIHIRLDTTQNPAPVDGNVDWFSLTMPFDVLQNPEVYIITSFNWHVVILPENGPVICCTYIHIRGLLFTLPARQQKCGKVWLNSGQCPRSNMSS